MKKAVAIVGGLLVACTAVPADAAWTHFRWDCVGGAQGEITGRFDLYFDFSTFSASTKSVGKSYASLRINNGPKAGFYTSGGIGASSFALNTSDGSYYYFTGSFANNFYWFLDHRSEVVFNNYSPQGFINAANNPYPFVRMSALPLGLFSGIELASIGSPTIDSAAPIIPASGTMCTMLGALAIGSRRRRTTAA